MNTEVAVSIPDDFQNSDHFKYFFIRVGIFLVTPCTRHKINTILNITNYYWVKIQLFIHKFN